MEKENVVRAAPTADAPTTSEYQQLRHILETWRYSWNHDFNPLHADLKKIEIGNVHFHFISFFYWTFIVVPWCAIHDVVFYSELFYYFIRVRLKHSNIKSSGAGVSQSSSSYGVSLESTVETLYSTIPYTTIFYITRWTHGPQNLQRPIRTLIVLLGFGLKQIFV